MLLRQVKINCYHTLLMHVLCSFILVANWGIPLAAIADMKKDPEYISGKMTTGEEFVHVYRYRMLIPDH